MKLYLIFIPIFLTSCQLFITSSRQIQNLPISAIATTPTGYKINLEVAQTSKEQSIGLMNRPALPDNRGMLFPFSPPQKVSFWMKNTPSPLDILFLYKGQVQHIASSVPPCTANPCPKYSPNQLIDQVLELRSGRTAELKLKPGSTIKIQKLN